MAYSFPPAVVRFLVHSPAAGAGEAEALQEAEAEVGATPTCWRRLVGNAGIEPQQLAR